MNRLSVLLVLGLTAIAPFPQRVEAVLDADLYYDPATGEVFVDTADTWTGGIIAYAIEVDPDQPIRLIPENFTPFLITPLIVAAAPHQIGENSLALTSGLYSMGNVLPAGISESDYLTMWKFPYYIAVFGGGDRRGSGPFDLFYGPAPGVPMNDPNLPDLNNLTWATAATILYDAGTGDVVIDTTGPNGGYITGFLLESDDRFIDTAFTPPPQAVAAYGYHDAVSVLSPPLPPDYYEIGQILERGLDYDQITQLFSAAWFVGPGGIGSTDFDFANEGAAFSFVVVPEPASILLLTLIAPAMLVRRRR